ncbi:MAG: iron chelate uptake ABC transporter family permease subunit [Corynebacterium sp.]|nr:iron chelate uptake ABC transporter family permease subunit [Corynebacterium sp.]
MLLVLTCFLSLAVGSARISLAEVWQVLWHPDDSNTSYNVHGLRLTRTCIGVLVGACLAAAGTIMQAVTRNPLADPGLLGVNSGASLGIVLGAFLLGYTSAISQIFLAALGAVLATIFVYMVGSAGTSGTSPVRLVLAGVAFSAASGGIVSAITLLRPEIFDSFRFWEVGALTRSNVPWEVFTVPILIGLGLAIGIVKALSNVALGDDMATALGTNVMRTRALALLSLTLLCAAATAIAGPLSYVGLIVPIFAHWVMGAHRGWIMAFSVLLGPIVLLFADILGRVIARPGEVAVGILTTFVGAPFLLYMVVQMRGKSL